MPQKSYAAHVYALAYAFGLFGCGGEISPIDSRSDGGGLPSPAANTGVIRLVKEAGTVSAEFNKGTSACGVLPALGTCALECKSGAGGVGAGSIRVEPANMASFTLDSLVVAGATSYDGSAAGPFVDNETIRVSASGDVVPAFTLNGKFPNALQVIAPTTSVTIDVSLPFEVEWNAIASPVEVRFEQPDTGTTLTCAFEGSSGRALVPAATLEKVRTMSLVDAHPFELTVLGVTETSTRSGDWNIVMRAIEEGILSIPISFK